MRRATRRLGYGGAIGGSWSPPPSPSGPNPIGFPANDNRPSAMQRARRTLRTIAGLLAGALALYLFGT